MQLRVFVSILIYDLFWWFSALYLVSGFWWLPCSCKRFNFVIDFFLLDGFFVLLILTRGLLVMECFNAIFLLFLLWFALLRMLSFVSWLSFHSDLRALCLLLIRNICSGLVYLVSVGMFVGTMLCLGSLIMMLCCSDENCAWFLFLNEFVFSFTRFLGVVATCSIHCIFRFFYCFDLFCFLTCQTHQMISTHTSSLLCCCFYTHICG